MHVNGTIPSFECRELRTLIPQLSKKGKELLDNLPASQKTAAYVLKYSHFFTIYPAVPLLFVGMYTFSAALIAGAIGLAASSFLIGFAVKKIFGSPGQVFLYEEMQKLNPVLFGFASSYSYLNSSASSEFLKDVAEDLRVRSTSDPEVKPMVDAFRTLAYAQIALNEFQQIISNEKLKNFVDLRPYINMSKAAQQAMKFFEDIKQNKDLFGITQSHIRVLKVLSMNKDEIADENEMKKSIFYKCKNQILKSLQILPSHTSMVDFTDENLNKINGLYTYLAIPI